MADRRKWTPARVRALEVFADTGSARESNVTDEADGLVYWQTLKWLVDEGLASHVVGAGRPVYELTEDGRLELQAHQDGGL